MNPENMIWDEQTKRVAAAFGAVDTGNFIEHVPYTGPSSKPPLPSSVLGHHFLKLGEDLELEVDYSKGTVVFEIGRISEPRTAVAVAWDGKLLGISQSTEHAWVMVKGLHCLGLLNPKIESSLKVGVSDDQKSEWIKSFKERVSILSTR